MTAYYNEIEPFAAAWLQNLIDAGHIAHGVIDTRSIEDVSPSDLLGFTQCHFFAGIGGWSLALRLAGWPDDRPAWTGSCPCQPFSAAGKGAGFADERHLWPAWQHLIAQCRPPVVFGEQVASKAVDAWIDLVHADLEGMGYAFGSIPFPAAGVGAPHIRDRNYWMGIAPGCGRERIRDQPAHGELVQAGSIIDRVGDAGQHVVAAQTSSANYREPKTDRPSDITCGPGVSFGRAADSDGGHAGAERQQRGGEHGQQPQDGGIGWLADTQGSGRREECADGRGLIAGDRAQGLAAGFIDGGSDNRPGPVNGFWRDADWIGCTDGKFRPVESGTQPLAHGLPNRVGSLRGYGNAIVPQAAAQFIGAYLDIERSMSQEPTA